MEQKLSPAIIQDYALMVSRDQLAHGEDSCKYFALILDHNKVQLRFLLMAHQITAITMATMHSLLQQQMLISTHSKCFLTCPAEI